MVIAHAGEKDLKKVELKGSLLLRLAGVLILVALLFRSVFAQTDYSSRDDVQTYIAEVAAEHNFPREELNQLFGEAERKQNVLDAISRPAERTLRWDEYRAIFVKPKNVEQGLVFWGENHEALMEAEQTYGVAAEYIVAIIGVETRWGRIMGKYRVIDSLTTLAFDYPPRAKFFRGELTEFLLLAREEGRNPLDFTGSYAGAMGYGQFIPSSYRSYAVDFDGDGSRDIWTSKRDAIGSVANYFKRHGWQGTQPVIVKVKTSGSEFDEVANESLELQRSLAELSQLGVDLPTQLTTQLNGDTKAALFRMEVEEGSEYWVGLQDFYVITRYNHSRMYALAVYQLGQEIKQRRLSAQQAGLAQADTDRIAE